MQEIEQEGASPELGRRVHDLEAELDEYKKKLAEQVLIDELKKRLREDPNFRPLKSSAGLNEITVLLAQSKKRAKR